MIEALPRRPHVDRAEVRTARIAAVGGYTPARILANNDLAALVDTSDEWIVQRTGIRERHVVEEGEHTSDLCIRAVEQLVGQRGVTLDDVDYVIVCTSTPDYVFPGVAALVQHHFGIAASGAFDLGAACAGFAYGLNVANALIASGTSRKTLLIGGEAMSRAIDYRDRSTCVLFGDGAGAALLEPGTQDSRIIATIAGSDGSGAPHLYRTALRSEISGIHDDTGLLRQNGNRVYKWVVETIPRAIATLLERAELRVSDIDWFVPHSANARIIERLCEITEISPERVLTTIETCGNTSTASIPLALSAAANDGRIRRGDRILTIGFGGGLVYAGAVLRW
ncbi:MAG TPA: ketoacyl-ACP synthase III [Candidatus Baltobacteraceae bacterium]